MLNRLFTGGLHSLICKPILYVIFFILISECKYNFCFVVVVVDNANDPRTKLEIPGGEREAAARDNGELE